ncbi:MAG: hypothetical protein ACTSUT_02955 [Promethearchaeota archaeon]
MNLIQAIQKVEAKDRERNQLLGKKSMLIEQLKNLGFKNLGDAKKEFYKLKKDIEKLNIQYLGDEKKFKEEFEHLLE